MTPATRCGSTPSRWSASVSKRWIGGRIREAGGGTILIVIDRDTESYPDLGAEVAVWVFQEGELRPGEQPIEAEFVTGGQRDEAKLGVAYQPQSPFHRLDAEEASLGLASTEMLMRELICRCRMNAVSNFDNAVILAEMLGGMHATEREYRPVDES